MVDTPTEPMNISADTPPSIYIQNTDGITHLGCVADGSVDLVLTDPPYIISRDSGMNEHYNTVKDNEAKKHHTRQDGCRMGRVQDKQQNYRRREEGIVPSIWDDIWKEVLCTDGLR
jgi:DNA modification methylase